MNPRRKRRQAIRFIENMIMNGNIKIDHKPENVGLIYGCEDLVERYDILPKGTTLLAHAPKWFDKQDISVMSLVKTEGMFFTDFALEINHSEFDIPGRKARWLYDQVESAKKQSSQQPVKTM